MKFWPCKKPETPEGAAYKQSFQGFKLKQFDVQAGPFVVLDTETTGLDVSKDSILSAGIMLVRDMAMSMDASRAWFIRQEDFDINQSSTVHGIVPADLEDGFSEKAFLRELFPLLHGAVLVGHHARFDALMLDAIFRRHFHVKCLNPIIDTAHFAMQELSAFHRTGYGNQPNPGLDEVCSELSIYPMERHTAWGDAFTTAEIFLSLCARLRQRLKRPIRMRDLPSIRL